MAGGTADGPAPLVVTAALEPAAQSWFDELRRAHFPPERNVLAAHVTLFHALLGEQEGSVRADLSEAAAGAGRALPVQVRRVRSLGRGVAYDLASPELERVHAELARRWQPWLTRQDAQRLSAHVTVQNKATPEAARALLAQLSAAFAPWTTTVVALRLWRYLGGPWEPVEQWGLEGPGPTGTDPDGAGLDPTASDAKADPPDSADTGSVGKGPGLTGPGPTGP